jgi:protein TonB
VRRGVALAVSLALHALWLGWVARTSLPLRNPAAGGGTALEVSLVRLPGTPGGSQFASAFAPQPQAPSQTSTEAAAAAAAPLSATAQPSTPAEPEPSEIWVASAVAAVAQRPVGPAPVPTRKRAARPKRKLAPPVPALLPVPAPPPEESAAQAVSALQPAPRAPTPEPSAPASVAAATVGTAGTPLLGESSSTTSELGTPGPAASGNPAAGGGFLKDATPLYMPDPAYPRAALAAGREGQVTVGFTIRSDGTTRDLHILSANPPEVFEFAALRAVATWRYEPPVLNGEIVERPNMQVTIDFRIKDRRSPMQRF